MPTIVQFRRGTEAQSDAFTGNVGELSVDTTNETVRVHDGSTAGGSRLATYAEVAAATGNIDQKLGATASVTLSGAVTGTANFSANAVSIATTATSDPTITLAGDLTGSVTLTNLGDGTLTAAVVDDSHNHSSSSGAFTVGTDLTVSGGDIILSGTGRIQGVDTVTLGTDAANKTYVDNAVAGVVDSAPAALDTLNELAAALGDDANFSTTVTTTIGEKLAKASNLSDLTNASTARTNLGLGTAATVDVGTTASKIVQLDGSARLPAVDGSQLTGISAGATVTDKNDNVNYNIVFTNQTSGTQSLAGIDASAFTFNPSTGTCNATVFNATSDKKLKKNIQTISDSLGKVSQLRGVNFDWKKNSIKSMGVIAQEVEVIVPEVVSTDEGDQKSVNYGALVGLLIEAVKDLKNEVDELRANK